jgi:hypothetical protein
MESTGIKGEVILRQPIPTGNRDQICSRESFNEILSIEKGKFGGHTTFSADEHPAHHFLAKVKYQAARSFPAIHHRPTAVKRATGIKHPSCLHHIARLNRGFLEGFDADVALLAQSWAFLGRSVSGLGGEERCHPN